MRTDLDFTGTEQPDELLQVSCCRLEIESDKPIVMNHMSQTVALDLAVFATVWRRVSCDGVAHVSARGLAMLRCVVRCPLAYVWHSMS